ncbi:MAG: hypothetical protein U9P90_02535 [Patescibacteria group bacterium]|nr:hypothetical protein [Patescibacteria group bacterium]
MFTKTSTSKIVRIVRKSFFGIIAIFILLILVLSFFLYENIYTAITQSEEIVILQGQLALKPVDISLFRKISKRIEAKKARAEIMLDELKNPFLPYNDIIK